MRGRDVGYHGRMQGVQETESTPSRVWPGCWWLGLALVGLCFVLSRSGCGGNAEEALRAVPIGTKLSDLDQNLRLVFDESEVEEWLDVRSSGSAGQPKKTRYGTFRVRSRGDYRRWTATKAEREVFTGEIVFMYRSWVIPDDWDPSYVVALVFVDGVLRDKDFGFLPG